MNDAQWLQERQKGIGGSDIGVILGVSVDGNGRPYKTPFQLWLEKTGRAPPTIETKFMTAGKFLEPVIVEMWRQATGFEIVPHSDSNVLYHHPDYPFALGTPDRIYLNNGQRGILECKNTRRLIHSENLPKSWFCQIQWYMGLTGIQQAEIAWLVQGCDFFHTAFNFSPEFWNYCIEKAATFWRYVETDQPPPPMNGDDASKLFPTHLTGKTVEATEVTLELWQDINKIRLKIKELENEENHIIDTLKLIMKDSEALVDEHGKILVTWQAKEEGKRRFFIRK